MLRPSTLLVIVVVLFRTMTTTTATALRSQKRFSRQLNRLEDTIIATSDDHRRLQKIDTLLDKNEKVKVKSSHDVVLTRGKNDSNHESADLLTKEIKSQENNILKAEYDDINTKEDSQSTNKATNDTNDMNKMKISEIESANKSNNNTTSKNDDSHKSNDDNTGDEFQELEEISKEAGDDGIEELIESIIEEEEAQAENLSNDDDAGDTDLEAEENVEEFIEELLVAEGIGPQLFNNLEDGQSDDETLGTNQTQTKPLTQSNTTVVDSKQTKDSATNKQEKAASFEQINITQNSTGNINQNSTSNSGPINSSSSQEITAQNETTKHDLTPETVSQSASEEETETSGNSQQNEDQTATKEIENGAGSIGSNIVEDANIESPSTTKKEGSNSVDNTKDGNLLPNPSASTSEKQEELKTGSTDDATNEISNNNEASSSRTEPSEIIPAFEEKSEKEATSETNGNPTKEEVDTHAADDDDGLIKEIEKQRERFRQRHAHIHGYGALLAVAAMIFTAWQMSDNPDGIYAALCRLILTIFGLICRLALSPFRGQRNPYGHMPVSTMDYGYRDPSLELA